MHYETEKINFGTAKIEGSINKVFLKIISVVFLLSLLLTVNAHAELVKTGESVAYQTQSSIHTGINKIGNELYYYNSAGILQKDGWVKAQDGKEYYASSSGSLLRNTWIKKRKKKYYLKEDGSKAKGLTAIGKKLYFFSEKNGKLLKGEILDSKGNVYYTSKSGEVYHNKFFKYKKKKYYAYKDGTLAKGLCNINGNLYYFKKSNGKMVTNKKKTIKGDTYYFQQDGTAAKNKWVKISGKRYYFLENGKMAKNMYIGSKWYVDSNGVRMKASKANNFSIKKVGSKTYVYNGVGSLVKNKWVKIDDKTYYADANGVAFVGMHSINSKSYYFDKDGVLQTNTIIIDNGVAYNVADDGHVTGKSTSPGALIVAFANKYIGLKYVWGGTSLKSGADCSGFCQSVFNNFGIKLMRVADDQMKGPNGTYQKLGYKKGTKIEDKNLMPGDLVFYDSSKDGVADHVAMYIGNNQVIHEAGSKYGCIITDIDWAHGRVKNSNMRYWA